MSTKLMEDAACFIRQLGGDYTPLPKGYEFSPFITVTWRSRIQDHDMVSRGAFVTHFMSPNPLLTTSEAIKLALRAESLLLGLKKYVVVYANNGKSWGVAKSFEDLYGSTITISVGGVPKDQAEWYLNTMANLLHKNWIHFQGEN